MSILAQTHPTFNPVMRVVVGITNDFPASVTTSFAHNYGDGTTVRLMVPLGYGMEQANKLFGDIIVTSPTTFNIAIDTRYFPQFVIPGAPYNLQFSQCIPFGENALTLKNSFRNILPY